MVISRPDPRAGLDGQLDVGDDTQQVYLELAPRRRKGSSIGDVQKEVGCTKLRGCTSRGLRVIASDPNPRSCFGEKFRSRLAGPDAPYVSTAQPHVLRG